MRKTGLVVAMKAVILDGGFGKRLGPLTEDMPKALIEVGGKPVIHWQIKWLSALGINEFVVLAGYKADKLINYIKSAGYSDKFKFSIEDEPLGTAGALKRASNLLQDQERFLLIYGDNITNVNANLLHLDGNEICCLALMPYRSHAGIAKIGGSKIISFEEKPTISDHWINGGVILASTRLFELLPVKGSLETEVLPRLAGEGKLSCVTFSDSYLKGIDTLKRLEEVDADIRSGTFKI